MRARPARSFAAAVVVGVVGVVVGVAGCGGGVGVEAPHTIGADEDTGCPSADEALAKSKAALDSPDMDALRPVLTRVLVEEGGLKIVLKAAGLLIQNGDPVTFKQLLDGIDPQKGLGGLTPHVVNVLQYVEGTSPYVEGEHPEPVVALHSIFTQCDAAETMSTLRALLELEVVTGPDGKPQLAPPGLGEKSWLAAVLDGARVAFQDENVRAVLQGISLDDDQSEGQGIHIGKDAFELVAKLLAENLSADQFDPLYTRQLLDDVVVARITDDASRAKVDGFLDLILLITDPNADVFTQTQSFMRCVNQADSDAALPGMIYDWLTIPDLSVDTFLDDVSSSTGTDSAGDLRLAVINLLSTLDASPDLERDTSAVVAKLIDVDVSRITIHALLDVQGKGVVSELAHLKEAIEACHPGTFE